MTRNVLFASLVGVFLVVRVGLLVRRRQVGLARGTWWPVGSSAGRMVARTARWSHGRFHGWASKPRLSRDYVGAESWVWLAETTPSLRGFHWFARKPLGSLVDPQSQDRRPEVAAQGPVWLVGTGLVGGAHQSDRCATMQFGDFEAEDTHRDRKACVEAKQVCGRRASIRWCYNEVSQKALRGHVS
jgi:hypothetical protein